VRVVVVRDVVGSRALARKGRHLAGIILAAFQGAVLARLLTEHVKREVRGGDGRLTILAAGRKAHCSWYEWVGWSLAPSSDGLR
jgi:hypothetical protein